MAPTSMQDMLMDEVLNRIGKRYVCSYGYDVYGDCYSRWNTWGRWVALAVVVVAFILLAFLFSRYNSRRRRRRGMAPMYGTGWMGGNWGHKPPFGQQYGNNGGYYPNQPYNGGAAPPYEPPVPNQATGTTFNSNDGYYGHNNAYELQPPQSSYQPQRGGDPVYDAPQGPPPTKGDGIIR